MKFNLKLIKENLQETIDIVNEKHYETDFGDGRKKEAEEILALVNGLEKELKEKWNPRYNPIVKEILGESE